MSEPVEFFDDNPEFTPCVNRKCEWEKHGVWARCGTRIEYYFYVCPKCGEVDGL
jgi:hypothetical protein